jgi:hypothetical protein
MLIFARNHLRASTRAECRPSYGVPIGNATAEMKELFQLNQFLFENSHLYATAKAVAAEWPLLGIFKNETSNNASFWLFYHTRLTFTDASSFSRTGNLE